jgi:hypothetical protein
MKTVDVKIQGPMYLCSKSFETTSIKALLLLVKGSFQEYQEHASIFLKFVSFHFIELSMTKFFDIQLTLTAL